MELQPFEIERIKFTLTYVLPAVALYAAVSWWIERRKRKKLEILRAARDSARIASERLKAAMKSKGI
jgi:hypothetical protein